LVVANELTIVPRQLEAFSAVNEAAAATITSAGSADSEAMLGAAATAVGPIGAGYLAAYAPAQLNNLTGTLLVGGVHAAVSGATEASKTSFLATDQP
jgi:hypothetical protein